MNRQRIQCGRKFRYFFSTENSKRTLYITYTIVLSSETFVGEVQTDRTVAKGSRVKADGVYIEVFKVQPC